MNDAVMDLLMDRMDSRRGRRDRMDSRRGVKGTGRGRRDMRDSRRHDYADYDEYDEYEDHRDMGHKRHSELRLTKADLKEWKHMLENADGTRGPHFDMQQIMHVADKLGLDFEDFTEAEFCMAVNMIYSDHCKSIKKYVQGDKALEFCAEQALEFLDDMDGPDPATKLMLYYHCIVNA